MNNLRSDIALAHPKKDNASSAHRASAVTRFQFILGHILEKEKATAGVFLVVGLLAARRKNSVFQAHQLRCREVDAAGQNRSLEEKESNIRKHRL